MDRIYGLTEQQFDDTGKAVKAIQSGVRPVRTNGSIYPVPPAQLAYYVCATEDWTAFGTVTCRIRSGDTLTDDELECVAIGEDGTDKAGTRGIAILAAGADGAVYQFIPLECEPTCDLG